MPALSAFAAPLSVHPFSADPSAADPSAPQLWTLSGGLRVAFERRSGPGFAFDLRIPVGSAHDPVGQEGAAAVLEEWLYKGARTAGGLERDAHDLQDAFDDLGVRRGGGVGPEATRISISGLREDLGAALALVADVLLRPTLPPDELPTLLDLARQDLDGLQDSPTDLLAIEARRLTFPRAESDTGAGYAHPTSGTLRGLANLSAPKLQGHLTRFGQAGSVLGIVAEAEAGKILALVEGLFGAWQPGQDVTIPSHFVSGVRGHLAYPDGEQTHISLCAPGIHPKSPDWLAWQLALTALSGGSSSRLFAAVREERGLAYSVSATPLVLGGRGYLSVYAGSTPQNAPETLEVIQTELSRLSDGLSEAEFRRAHAALSASIVFGGESLRGRAYAMTRDLTLFGRLRTVAGLRAELDALTFSDINDFLAGYQPLAEASIVTLGPEKGVAQEAHA